MVLEELDVRDDYAKEQTHTWPGLSSKIGESFSAVITGYLNIGAAASYTFTLTASDAAAIYFDDATAPLIVIEGRSETTRSETDSIELSSGRHLMRIYYLNYRGAARLKLQYESAAAGLPKTVINQLVTFVGGRAPSFLSSAGFMSFVGAAISTEVPRVTGSYLTGFSITPALPQGLAINTVSGVISGSSDVEMDGDYTVCAAGPLGESQKAIHISIGSSPLPGLHAQYYRLEDSEDVCKLTSFPSSLLTLVHAGTDEIINHEQMASGFAWDGVPQDVFPRFYVVWTGFFHVDTPGNYFLRISSADGSRLWINNELVLNSWSCRDGMEGVGVSRAFENVGYYPIKLEFFSNAKKFGMLLHYRKPGQNQETPMPASLFWHLPSSSFTYAVPHTHYYRGAPISNNAPLFFGMPSASFSFSVTPALPNGLTLQADGVISGTPREDSEETVYTITASSQGVTYTTTVSFAVSYVAPPTDLTITDKDGAPLSAVTVNQFETISPIQLRAENNPVNWRFDPALPDGLALNLETLQIEGMTHLPLAQTTITVIASNGGGAATKTFAITVIGCQYGKAFYTFATGNSPSSFLLQNANTNATVAEAAMIPQGYYGVSMCVPSDEYRATFTCMRSPQFICIVRLYREDGMLYVAELLRGSMTVAKTFSTEVQEPPVVKPDKNHLALLLRQKFSVRVTVEGVYREIQVEGDLPSTVTFDGETLSGSFTERGSYNVTLFTENDKGRGEAMVTFNVGTCPDGQAFVSFVRKEGGGGDSVLVTDESGKKVLNHKFSDAAFEREMCLPNGEYAVAMKAKNGGSWAAGLELIVKDAWDDVLASPFLDNDKGEKTEYFTVNFAIMDRLDMKFYNGAKAPAAKWNTLGFNDKSWATANHDTFGSFVANTAYFRKEFTVDNRGKYPLFAFDLEIFDGAIAYINGKEVARRNMAAEGVTHASTAVDRYDSLLWRRTSVPTSVLQNGKNVLAVELHRSEGAAADIVFDVYGSLLSGECLKRTDRGAASGSDHSPAEQYVPANAFDDNVKTMWRDRTLPAFVQFAYNNDRFEFVNKVVVYPMYDASAQNPKKFEIWGMTGDDKGDVLAAVDDRNFFDGRQPSTVFLKSERAYKAYRLVVEEGLSRDVAGIAEMVLYACNIVYCPKMKGWESVRTGVTTYGACPRRTFGEAVRTCEYDKYEAVWSAVDYSNCLSTVPAADTAYIDFKYMVSNCGLSTFDAIVKDRFIDITRDILMLKKDDIKPYLVRDCSDSETINVCFNMRLVADLRIADYVFDNVNKLQEQMTYRMYTNPPKDFPEGLYFIMVSNPLLRTPGSKIAGIIVVVLVVLIVLGTILIVYNIRQGKLGKRLNEGLRRKNTAESYQERKERTRKEKENLL